MARSTSRKSWPRRRPGSLVLHRVLDIAGIGMVIVCVLASLGFVLMEAGNQVFKK
ncbi:MAG: hypothetical protein ABR923_00275 [Terracidiphilus sp.]|jgi:hypothetical protein